MNKNQMVKEIAEKANVTQSEAKKILDATLDVMSEHLIAGDEVKLKGFGHFRVEVSPPKQIPPGTEHLIVKGVDVPECEGRVIHEAIGAGRIRQYQKSEPIFKASDRLKKVIIGPDVLESEDSDKTNDPGEFFKGIRE
ncbi:HU family DNA-binding protein [Vibrio parahaemolyticus]|nr:HU family DNA-binding protein [Vibrio parahaemolyticus]